MGFRKKSEESSKKLKSARTKRRETQGLDYAKEIDKKVKKSLAIRGRFVITILATERRKATSRGRVERRGN